MKINLLGYKILMIFFLNLVFFVALAQVNQKDLPAIIPPSPEMSSLGKFIEQPVSKYTGVAKVAVPIYTIKESDIEMPVSINYHSSGIKVEEVSGWVGLGWSLSTGGSIMRSVRGLPDDFYSKKTNFTTSEYECVILNNAGYLYCSQIIDTVSKASIDHSLTTYPELDVIQEVAMGARDGLPDLFYFSFGKYSGEFLFDKNGNINIIPKQDLKISMQRQNGREIIGFSIVTPEGLEYTFNETERSTVTSRGYTSPVTNDYGYNSIQYALDNYGPFFGLSHQLYNTAENWNACETGGFNRMTYNSAWQLSSVVSLKTKAKIELKYRKENVHTQGYSGETLFWWDENRDETAYKTKSAASSFIVTKVIDTIQWTSGRVLFLKDAVARLDLDDKFNNNYALDKIVVKNLDESTIKSFKLYHDYFTSFIAPSFQDNQGTNYTNLKRAFQKRLRLTSITEDGSRPYFFEYTTTTGLPHRASLEQDFWGYYNANSSISTMFPTTFEYPSEMVNETTYHSSNLSFYPRSSYTGSQKIHTKLTADRSANETAAQAWMLNTITYPTGGATKLFYALNEFYINGQKIKGGGLRIIKQITSSDATFSYSTNMTKEYDYHESGQIVDIPQFAAATPVLMYYTTWSAGLALTQGSFVGYGKVSEVTPLGKITDLYSMPAMYGTSEYGIYKRPKIRRDYGSRVPLLNNCVLVFNQNIGYEFYPRPNAPNYDWGRGMPMETIVYDNAGNMKERNKTFYSLKNYSKIYNVQASVIYTEVQAWGDEGSNDCFTGRHSYNYTGSYSIAPWIVVDSTVSYKIENGDSIIIGTKHLYESPNHFQKTQIRTRNSSGNNLVTKFKYSPDYVLPGSSSDAEVLGIQAMQLRNVIIPAVESMSFIEKDNIEYLKSAKLNTYKVFGINNLLLPYKTYITQNNTLLTGFQQSSVTSGVLLKNENYEEQLVFNEYDLRGNMLSLTKRGNLSTSFLWGYNSTLPIAEVNNATFNNISHTSFENNDHGGFNYNGTVITNYPLAVSGSSIYNLSTGSISRSINSLIGYTVSLWSTSTPLVNGNTPQLTGRSLGNWTLYQYYVNNSSQIIITGSGNVDEVRLYPSAALMKTYTYKPLVGMLSSNDANNNIAYYDYDSYSRLVTIRDQDKNIKKKICYNYSGQQVDCSSPCINTIANWQNTMTPLRCQQTTSCSYTGYQEQEQKDMNTCSPTYSQVQWVIAGYNPTACSGTNVPITYATYNTPGFTATYTNTLTNQVYTFPIPGTGSGVLGCVPAGTYSLTIIKPLNSTIWFFDTGCFSMSGTSASFGKVRVSATACNQIHISLPFE